jgi:metal-sulfur cluster biosynthetic enzyme
MTELVNPSPQIFAAGGASRRSRQERQQELDDQTADPIDALEIFELLRRIKDPEHPNTLEQLKVIEPECVDVRPDQKLVKVRFTPTVPHCSMTTLIGLCIRVKLERSLPPMYKIDVSVTPGSHDQELQVNKQLGDKERVAAALENENLLNVVASCLNEFD